MRKLISRVARQTTRNTKNTCNGNFNKHKYYNNITKKYITKKYMMGGSMHYYPITSTSKNKSFELISPITNPITNTRKVFIHENKIKNRKTKKNLHII